MSWTSPCRRHPCSWWHAELVSSYRAARAAQDARAEAWSAGYATELAAFYREVEAPLTFRDWLVWSRGSSAEAA